MRLSKRRRTGTAAVNMTPMIDIVFLLVIFFMTVTQVTKINREKVDLAKQKGSADQESSTVIVNAMENGDIMVYGNKVSIPELVFLVSDQLDQLRQAGKGPNQLTVAIRADQRGTSATPNKISTAMAGLGLKRIRFAVEVPGP